jgi:hypothetical protein
MSDFQRMLEMMSAREAGGENYSDRVYQAAALLGNENKVMPAVPRVAPASPMVPSQFPQMAAPSSEFDINKSADFAQLMEQLGGQQGLASDPRVQDLQQYSASPAANDAYTPYLNEIENGATKGALDLSLERTPKKRFLNDTEIMERRAKIDAALNNIVQELRRPLPVDRINLPLSAFVNEPLFKTQDQMQDSSQRFNDAIVQQSDIMQGRALDPLKAELQREQFGLEGLLADRKFEQDERENQLEQMMQYLQIAALTGKAAPTFELKTIETPDGKQTVLFDPKNPDSLQNVGAPKKAQRKPSAYEIKEVGEIDEQLGAGVEALEALDYLEQLNNQAAGGTGTDMQLLASRLPVIGGAIMDPATRTATTELDNTIKEKALSSLKSTFGGNPTEGERGILIDIQGSIGLKPDERAKIFKRARQKLQASIKRKSARREALASGEFMTKGFASTMDPASLEAINALGIDIGGADEDPQIIDSLQGLDDDQLRDMLLNGME